MPASNKLALGVFLAFVAMTTVVTPSKILSYSTFVLADPKQTDESQIPVTDYLVLEPKDPAERAKRKEKGRRYTGKRIKENTRISVVTDSDSRVQGLAPLPIANSDVVVIGEVRSAEAYLSDDKNGIYSEFSIRIEQVLKSNGESSFEPGSLIVAEREGGGVRFPSGHVQYYVVDGERMPKVWSRYLLFLKRNDQRTDFWLLKAYELRADGVFPMDDFSKDAVYKGMNPDLFINATRNAIPESSRTPSENVRKGREQ